MTDMDVEKQDSQIPSAARGMPDVLTSHASFNTRQAEDIYHERSADRENRVPSSASFSDASTRGDDRVPPDSKETEGVPGAEKVTEDGKIIHTWESKTDPDNPFNWSTKYKWVVTITVCFISILTGIPAGSYGVGSSYYSSKFDVQIQPFDNSIWATVSWNMGAAFFPLVFVPMTESTGRMPG